MARLDELVEDYSRHQVPDEKTVSGIRIGLIIIGVAITVPAFVVGSEMGLAIGAWPAISAFFLGGVCLSIIAGCAGVVGARTRYSTAMIIRSTFGAKGSVLVNLVIGIIWLGWYAVIAAFFGRALAAGFETFGWGSVSEELCTIFGSVLMVLVTIFGFKALDKLSLAAVPVMATFLGFIVWRSSGSDGLEAILATPGAADSPMGLGAAASLVVGTFIVGGTMFPDICRYARSPGHAAFGSLMAFAGGFPLVLAFAALPSIATGESDLMTVITLLGMAVAGVIMLIFATWTTNAYNLYSSTLAFAPIFHRFDRWKLVIVVALIGTAIAMLGILDHFMQWVGLLAVAVPPIAGVYVADFLLFSRHETDRESGQQSGYSWPAFIAWLVGIMVAYLANEGQITLTAIPAIDGIASATLAYWLMRRYQLTRQ